MQGLITYPSGACEWKTFTEPPTVETLMLLAPPRERLAQPPLMHEYQLFRVISTRSMRGEPFMRIQLEAIPTNGAEVCHAA